MIDFSSYQKSSVVRNKENIVYPKIRKVGDSKDFREVMVAVTIFEIEVGTVLILVSIDPNKKVRIKLLVNFSEAPNINSIYYIT